MADIAIGRAKPLPPTRPERVIELEAMGAVGDAARPLSTAERLLQITGVRRLIVRRGAVRAWQAYASYLNNSLLFPTLAETLEALYDSVVSGTADRAHAGLAADAADGLRGRRSRSPASSPRWRFRPASARISSRP